MSSAFTPPFSVSEVCQGTGGYFGYTVSDADGVCVCFVAGLKPFTRNQETAEWIRTCLNIGGIVSAADAGASLVDIREAGFEL